MAVSVAGAAIRSRVVSAAIASQGGYAVPGADDRPHGRGENVASDLAAPERGFNLLAIRPLPPTKRGHNLCAVAHADIL
jgi:hypothetical protein